MTNQATTQLIGTWHLAAHSSEDADIEAAAVESIEKRQDAIRDFFEQTHTALEMAPTTGLHLTIADDHTFTEGVEGEPTFDWFDDEGVMCHPTPFDGLVVNDDAGIYIRPHEILSWATPKPGEYGCILRHDDGDTKICDRLIVDGDDLFRIMSVVTDELYTNRLVYHYQRQQ